MGECPAFDLPLATMKNESFNPPIFFANNMTGVSPALEASVCFPADISWCITFKDGGVGTFLPLFLRLLAQMRATMRQPAQQTTPVVSQAFVQTLVGSAYVDPSDPTCLYVSKED